MKSRDHEEKQAKDQSRGRDKTELDIPKRTMAIDYDCTVSMALLRDTVSWKRRL
jgi:hypothetical protein